MKFAQWQDYVFWDKLKEQLPVPLPGRARRLQHVHEQGTAAGADLVAVDRLDRRGARPEHEGRLPVLHRQGRRLGHQRVREDARRARQERGQVRQELTWRGGAAGRGRLRRAARRADAAPLGRRRRSGHRPARLAALRARMAAEGVDAYFGARPEHMRWLTGFALAEGEDKVVGQLRPVPRRRRGRDRRDRLAVHDPGTSRGDRRRDRRGRLRPAGRLAPAAGVRRRAARRPSRRQPITHALWRRLEAAAPGVEHVPVEGWIEALRAVKRPDEVERIAAACAVADRALAALLPDIRPGATERDLALRLEWLIRTGGAEALAFDVACLAGPEAALPHGSPGDRPVLANAVLLFDFGAQVDGYRSDMTRTLFVGEPTERDLARLRPRPPGPAGGDRLDRGAGRGRRHAAQRSRGGRRRPRDHRRGGRWPAYGHGLGHGIGLATHEQPRLGRQGTDDPLPSPTVFSIEPGIYLEGEIGVRIEDLSTSTPGAAWSSV